MSSALSLAVKKDKKKKKKKLTSKQRALEKLEKESEKFMKNADITNDLIISVSNWLKPRQKFAHKLFSQQRLQSVEHDAFKAEMKKLKGGDDEEHVEEAIVEKKEEKDQGADGAEQPKPEPVEIEEEFKINYDDFKLVLIDMNIPCTNVKLHVLCKLLDASNLGFIDYRNCTPEFIRNSLNWKHIDGIKAIKRTEPTKYLNSFTFKEELSKTFLTDHPLYLKLDLKMLTFADLKEYKSYMKDVIVYSHMQIYGLIEMIREKTDIASNKICIYKEANRSKSSYLDEYRTLESYGFVGLPYDQMLKKSDKLVLYYDYYLFADYDPILNCDFYFHNYPKNSTKSSHFSN